MKFISLGFAGLVQAGRIIAVVTPEAAPIRRLVQEARDRGSLIDASCGRKTRSVLLMDSDHVLLSALPPEHFTKILDSVESMSDEED